MGQKVLASSSFTRNVYGYDIKSHAGVQLMLCRDERCDVNLLDDLARPTVVTAIQTLLQNHKI